MWCDIGHVGGGGAGVSDLTAWIPPVWQGRGRAGGQQPLSGPLEDCFRAAWTSPMLFHGNQQIHPLDVKTIVKTSKYAL